VILDRRYYSSSALSAWHCVHFRRGSNHSTRPPSTHHTVESFHAYRWVRIPSWIFCIPDVGPRVLAILMPTAFFCALNTHFAPTGFEKLTAVTDRVRGEILKFSRGMAVLLLIL